MKWEAKHFVQNLTTEIGELKKENAILRSQVVELKSSLKTKEAQKCENKSHANANNYLNLHPIGKTALCKKSSGATVVKNSRATGVLLLSETYISTFSTALQKLKEYDFLWIVFPCLNSIYNNMADMLPPEKLKSLQERTVLTTKSIDRLCPIDLRLVRVVKFEGTAVYFEGLDVPDLTPIFDVIPFVNGYHSPLEIKNFLVDVVIEDEFISTQVLEQVVEEFLNSEEMMTESFLSGMDYNMSSQTLVSNENTKTHNTAKSKVSSPSRKKKTFCATSRANVAKDVSTKKRDEIFIPPESSLPEGINKQIFNSHSINNQKTVAQSCINEKLNILQFSKNQKKSCDNISQANKACLKTKHKETVSKEKTTPEKHPKNIKSKTVSPGVNIKAKIKNHQETAETEVLSSKEKEYNCVDNNIFLSKAVVQPKQSVKCNLEAESFSKETTEKIACSRQTDSVMKKSKDKISVDKNTNEVNFQCNVCFRTFVKKHQIEYHWHTKIIEGKYLCCICLEAGFLNEDTLKDHVKMCKIRKVTKKMLKCFVCARLFRTKHHLQSHLWSHIEEKLFQCNTCKKLFRHKSNLICHLKNHKKCQNVSPASKLHRTELKVTSIV